MKKNKFLIILTVLLLNALVLYIISQSLLSETSEYDKLLAEARDYAKQELCSKSIDKYNEVLSIDDRLDVRIEMISVYEKGMEIGEFTNAYVAFNAVEKIIEDYPEEIATYENAGEFFLRYGNFEDCAETIMQARDLRITSKKIEELKEKVRYQYERHYSMYQSVLPYYGGYFTVSTNESFSFLDGEASPSSSGEYTYLSSFSEGYAFAKAVHPDGTEKSFIINEKEQRQVYLDGVTLSSGVGVAKDKEGKQLLLLSCNVEDRYAYYKINGEKAFGDYEFAGRFRNNIAAVKESGDKWKLIDGTGKTIVDKTFTDIVLNELDECAPKGIIIANDGSGYHLYNHKGEQIGDFVCDEAKAFVDSYAAFKLDDKWGFVDMEGKVVIEAQYDDAKSFSNKMGAVKKAESWGFINSENEIVVEESFEDVSYLNEKGICFVKIDGYWSNLEFYYTGE